MLLVIFWEDVVNGFWGWCMTFGDVKMLVSHKIISNQPWKKYYLDTLRQFYSEARSIQNLIILNPFCSKSILIVSRKRVTLLVKKCELTLVRQFVKKNVLFFINCIDLNINFQCFSNKLKYILFLFKRIFIF